MTEFCLQCGLEHRPVRAVGWDEDGEPACTGHSVKSKRPLTLTQAPASEPAAAPSPVQTKAEEEMGTQSRGLRPRSICKVCGREIADFVLAKHMRAKHGGDPTIAAKQGQGISTAKTLADLNEFHGLKRGALIDATKVPADALIGSGSQTNESIVTLQLSESKVQKLLNLLLQ